MTVRLQGGAKKGTTYQYRPAGAVGWQTAADGAVQVADLKAGDYTLEFRTLDADGKPSPVVARTWKVNPTPPVVVKSVPGLRQGDRFFQEVVVRRVSSYSVLGAPLSQDVRYTLVSSFRIDKLAADGSMEVTQKVEGVHLSDAAPAMLAQLNDLLQKTKGATFILTLNAKREVTSFKGADAALKVFKGANPLGGQSFLLWSFLDRDGWKELAGITFFRPEKPLRRGEKWARKMTHSWGPLGRWVGKVAYVNAGSKGDLHQFNYVLDMAYRPPAAGAAAALPFKIAKADFRVLVARGAIVYDAAKGRVARAEELFSVRGILAVEVLGTSSPVEMDEKQVFQIRVLDRNPLTK